jgi:hypothetical protein
MTDTRLAAGVVREDRAEHEKYSSNLASIVAITAISTTDCMEMFQFGQIAKPAFLPRFLPRASSIPA